MEYSILNKIDNKEEKSLENSLGVSILRDGTPLYFNGKLHGEAFMKDVETCNEYKNLNIKVDISLNTNERFYNKTCVIASQGIITMCNAGNMILIYSPDVLSNNQALVMQKFYDDFLCKCKMVIIALVNENGEYTQCLLDEYMNLCSENNKIHIKK